MEEVKVHRIGNSKEPTLNQIQRMVDNLRNKLNCYIVIKVEVWHHSTDSITDKKVDYWLGTGNNIFNETIGSWPKVLTTYRKLMKG